MPYTIILSDLLCYIYLNFFSFRLTRGEQGK
jgi:hypothetical protein